MTSPHLLGVLRSHVGCVREVNEDHVLCDIPATEEAALLVVADGMGGLAAGAEASAMAAHTVLRCFRASAGPVPERLAQCFDKANRAVLASGGTGPARRERGTTCTVLVVEDGRAFLAHIGDSRAYLWRAERLSQLSEDHNLAADMVRAGEIAPEEAARRPERNFLSRALGPDPLAEPDIWASGLALRAGDRLILCSDGLWSQVANAEIARLAAFDPPEAACEALIAAALAAGAPDNVSVGVFCILDPG